MVLDTSKFIGWLKQPSTIKMLGAASGFLGFAYTQADLEKWTAGIVAFSMFINGFYDNIPRAKSLTVEKLCGYLKKLTPEERAELMKLYKGN